MKLYFVGIFVMSGSPEALTLEGIMSGPFFTPGSADVSRLALAGGDDDGRYKVVDTDLTFNVT